jgi:hypothetical protein
MAFLIFCMMKACFRNEKEGRGAGAVVVRVALITVRRVVLALSDAGVGLYAWSGLESGARHHESPVTQECVTTLGHGLSDSERSHCSM